MAVELLNSSGMERTGCLGDVFDQPDETTIFHSRDIAHKDADGNSKRGSAGHVGLFYLSGSWVGRKNNHRILENSQIDV